MFQRLFTWLAVRKMNRSHYRIDKRQYRGIFKPGFMAHLASSNFWQSDNDPYWKARRRKNRFFATLVTIALIGFGWMIWEGMKAFSIF